MTVRLMLKVCSVAALIVLVVFALGPAKWTPRSGLGFEFDHFVGYFFFTLLFCLAWPRPFAVGGVLAVLAIVLENLQSFLPGRSSYFVAALYSAATACICCREKSFNATRGRSIQMGHKATICIALIIKTAAHS
jgi:VanZ family protein